MNARLSLSWRALISLRSFSKTNQSSSACFALVVLSLRSKTHIHSIFRLVPVKGCEWRLLSVETPTKRNHHPLKPLHRLRIEDAALLAFKKPRLPIVELLAVIPDVSRPIGKISIVELLKDKLRVFP